ncbi:MAG: hypothetical protein KKC71_01415 [Chloroflexi bacterium]|nr:hypothetical protein [Chloroflexota bacterium]
MREERQEKPKKSLRGLLFFAVQIHNPATALNRETTREWTNYEMVKIRVIRSFA